MPDKEINLVGVTHLPEKLESVLKRFPARGRGKSVGLEVDQFVMAEFERIEALQAKKKASFEKEFAEYYLKFLGLVKLKAGQPKARVEKDLAERRKFFSKHPTEMAKDLSQYRFFFDLFARLKGRGFQVKALERRAAVLQTLSSQLKARGKGEGLKLFVLLRGPVRSRWLVEKGPRADYWVLGTHHLADVEKGLKEKGLRTRVLSSEPPAKGLERVYEVRERIYAERYQARRNANHLAR